MSKTKTLLHEKKSGADKTSWCSSKKCFMSTKWYCTCRQKQDNAAQKNILYSKKLLIFTGTARHTQEVTFTKSSTDNFLSPIPASDWLIFCYGNLILHQEKKWK